MPSTALAKCQDTSAVSQKDGCPGIEVKSPLDLAIFECVDSDTTLSVGADHAATIARNHDVAGIKALGLRPAHFQRIEVQRHNAACPLAK